MNHIYSIYLITNKVNNKVYIGWTKKMPASQRFADHIRFSLKYYTDYAIHRAIRKHGESNFTFEVICQSKDGQYLLTEMEPYFIKKYDSFGPKGYNMTFGGNGTLGSPRPKSIEWRKNQSKRMSGNKNPMAYKRTNEEKQRHSETMSKYYKNNPDKKTKKKYKKRN